VQTLSYGFTEFKQVGGQKIMDAAISGIDPSNEWMFADSGKLKKRRISSAAAKI
jgi:GH25 family lysozyme M1 (1,4-beta-N-acetylmuramidase)